MIKARIGQKAPLFLVSDWVQGEPANFDQLTGRVVLLEVFQVNCPRCFLHALPQAVDLYQRYSDKGLTVLGIATAFEDFDKNTLENLQRLAKYRQVIGETLAMLNQHDMGIVGAIVPNFAPGCKAENRNLVLWEWLGTQPHSITVIDDLGRLPKSGESWRTAK